MRTFLWILLTSAYLLAPQAYAQTWGKYSFAQAGCSASFPTEPATAQENGVWTAQAKQDNIIFQIVVYLNKAYTKANSEAVLNESIEGFINPATDKIEKKENVEIAGLPAQQIQVRSQDGSYLVFRTIVGKNKLYQIAIAGTNPAQTLAQAKKFLDSVNIE